jgi:hypothetical protein
MRNDSTGSKITRQDGLSGLGEIIALGFSQYAPMSAVV